MSVRNLDSLFEPASVAVIGASKRPSSVGATVWHNLAHGGFAGPLYPVNPKYEELDGRTAYASIADLPETPELAVICTPASSVVALVQALAERGTRAAIVLTAGLSTEQKAAMQAAARPHLLRLLGPNCIGLLSSHSKLNASFAHINPREGNLAFVSQSGALVTAVLDWADAQAIGFSHIVSLGEHLDVDFGDMLDYLATDVHTRAILLYIESIEAPRKFMSAARAAARNKPVIVVKAGRSAQGQKAAASHTGALAGSDDVYDAAIARAGMLRVDTLQELFLAAETLTRAHHSTTPTTTPASEVLTILTNGGGAGVMAADAAAREGVPLATLSADTLARLDAVLPANWSHGNPVDIIGDAPAQRYVDALEILASDAATGTILFIHAPTAIVPSSDIARALAPVAAPEDGPAPRLLSSWLGGHAVQLARLRFTHSGIASYDTPEQAVRALAMLQAYARNQTELMEAPAAQAVSVAPDREAVRALVREALAKGQTLLTEPQAKAVLQAYRIPVVDTRTVPPDADVVAEAATRMGFPVVIKILSEQISHKSDVGGVALNLDSSDDVRNAVRQMLARVKTLRPDAVVDGFTLQAMVRRKHVQEVIVGATIDPVFGPIILFGQGGTAVEVMADRAVALPPLSEPLARSLVARTRIAKLLKGWRDTPAVDEAALHGVLLAVSQLLADIPELAELDINPLLVNFEGAIALDARIRLSAKASAGALNFAIRPYPAELCETIELKGRTLELRPIRPEDEALHTEFLQHLDIEDIRMRVFYSRRTMERSELARLTQIDYTREMAFVAIAPGPDGQPQTQGVVRAMADPDNISAEFGIIIRSELKGDGLGRVLMNKLIAYQRSQGTQRMVATVLRENHRMIDLAHSLGFVDVPQQETDSTRAVALNLQAGT
ncbi:MAG: bifunctional acetate--CoA ligase family protein/GNAT family N-acetyltransferase [Burkholderiales bacterium]|nr:bifunctional acetate--CoA ligase family protein/GNAT family N-acetyltransferase [Burkholderiales bacterium]